MLPPIKDFDWNKNISQMFGVNSELYLKEYGIPNHNGIDIVVQNENRGYGTPILASHDGYIEKITYDNPHHTRGNGVYLRGGRYSTVYWHLAGFSKDVQMGGFIKQGEILGLMGNSGKTFSSYNGIHAGTHLHFAIKDHTIKNNYGGFVDPTPFLYQGDNKLPIHFPTDLYIRKNGDLVSWLQTCLAIEGFAKDYEVYGYFGIKTMRDVRKLQEKNNINPPLGYCGRKTRNYLKRYTQQKV